MVGLRSEKYSGGSEEEFELDTEYVDVGNLDGPWLSILEASRIGC